MNKYRFRLGKTLDTSKNLVTEGDFSLGGINWVTNPGSYWTFAGGEALAAAVSSTDFTKNTLEQQGILTPGTEYYLSYDLKKQSGSGAQITVSAGGMYYDVVNDFDENLTAAYVNQVHSHLFNQFGTSLLFFQRAATPAAIDNVILYPYVWNAPLNDEPVNWMEAKITKKRDDILNGLIVNYIADLIFIGDGYNYLYAQYVANGYCGEIPIYIEVWNVNTNIYDLYYKGYIYINECEFNLTTHEVKVNITDSNASQVFVNSKNVRVNILPEYYYIAGNLAVARSATPFPVTAPSPLVAVVANDNAGSYVACREALAADIYALLRKLVLVGSKYKLDFDSTFFSSGTFDKFLLTTGALIKAGMVDYDSYTISMAELFNELNNLFDITFSIDNSGLIPKVKIEPKINYRNSTSVLTLNLVNDLVLTFDNENIVRAINIGYEHVDITATGIGADDPRGSNYKTDDLCAKKELNLVSKYIQSSTVIKELFDGTITGNKYDKVFVWLETTATLFTACDPLGYYKTRNSGSGTFDLNDNITELDNVLRHAETLNSDLIKSTVIGNETVVKPNAPLPAIYSFNYLITKDQFDLIAQAFNTVSFNTDGTGATTKIGYLIEANFKIKTGETEFKLLST